MNSIFDLKPDWISAPGQTINDILREREIEKMEFRKQMKCSVEFLDNLLEGDERITEDIACLLERNLGASKRFWLNREMQYRDYLEKIDDVIEDKWVQSLPYNEMVQFGWIKKTQNKNQDCLNFFNISNQAEWKENYKKSLAGVSFRKSNAFNNNVKVSILSAWLRQGEIQASKIQCKEWNPTLLEASIPEIRNFTRIKSLKIFLPKLIDICSRCGIALSIVKNPKGCGVYGATKFINESKAMMILSFRLLSDDHFWFTFFHEVGHLLLHDRKKVFVEVEKNKESISQEEGEANFFAGEVLLPEQFHDRLKTLRSNKRRIIQLAQDAGVSVGIIVGQMQYHGVINPSYLNGYKRYFSWEEITSGLELV